MTIGLIILDYWGNSILGFQTIESLGAIRGRKNGINLSRLSHGITCFFLSRIPWIIFFYPESWNHKGYTFMSFIFRECARVHVTCMDVYSIVSLRERLEWCNTVIFENKIELKKNDGEISQDHMTTRNIGPSWSIYPHGYPDGWDAFIP